MALRPLIRQNLQLLVLIFTVINTAFTITTTLWNRWSKLAYADPFNQIQPFAGLWFMCDSQLNPQIIYTCADKFSSWPNFILMRILMIIACFLNMLSVIISMFSMECAGALRQNNLTDRSRSEYKIKSILLLIVGLLMIISGIIVLCIVTWYAILVTKQFSIVGAMFSSGVANYTGVHTRMTIGPTCWLGWFTGGFSILTGMFWFCARVTDIEEMEDIRNFNEENLLISESSESIGDNMTLKDEKLLNQGLPTAGAMPNEFQSNELPTAGAPVFNQNIVQNMGPDARDFNYLMDQVPKSASSTSFSVKSSKSTKSGKSSKSHRSGKTRNGKSYSKITSQKSDISQKTSNFTDYV